MLPKTVALTVVRKMVIGFASLAILLVFTSFLSIFGLQEIRHSATKVVEQKMPMQKSMAKLKAEMLGLSSISTNAFFESSSVELQSNIADFNQKLTNFISEADVLKKLVGAQNQAKLQDSLTSSQLYIDATQSMFTQKLALLNTTEQLDVVATEAYNLADEASALMLDLSFIEGESRDLDALIGMSTNIDNKLGLVLSIIKELQGTDDPEITAASIDDITYNLSNIDADATYVNRLAETVEDDGLVESFNSEFATLKDKLAGQTGLFALQEKKLALSAEAVELKVQLDTSLQRAIDELSGLNELITSDTLQGQQDILDTVQNNILQTIALSVLGIAATVALAIIATRSISKPLSAVNKRLKVLSQGDLTQRLVQEGDDEFSELAGNVNILIDSLHGLIGSIHNQQERLTQITQHSIQVGDESLKQVAIQQEKITYTSDITLSVKETSLQNQQQISDASEEMRAAIEKTDEVMSLVEHSQQQVNEQALQSAHSAEIIHRLSENSNSIGSILDVIKTIAEQTNLLALNAAIEAARAGEQGRGFAVVADEVRTLATRTQKSTQEIESMISALQDDAEDAVSAINVGSEQAQKGVEITQNVTSQIIQIKTIIESLSAVNQKIVTDVSNQDVLLDDVVSSLQSIVELAQQTAQSTNDSNKATHDMGEQMDVLRTAVGKFRL